MIRKFLLIVFAAGILTGPIHPAQAGVAMAFPAVVIESVGPAAGLPDGWVEIRGHKFHSPTLSPRDHLVYFYNQDGQIMGEMDWPAISASSGDWGDDTIVFQMPVRPGITYLAVAVGDKWSGRKPLTYAAPVNLTAQAVQDSKGWWVETYPYTLPSSPAETWTVVYQLSPQLCDEGVTLVEGLYCEYDPQFSLPSGHGAIQDFKVKGDAWGWITVQTVFTPSGDAGRAVIDNARVFIPQTKWQLYLPLVIR